MLSLSIIIYFIQKDQAKKHPRENAQEAAFPQGCTRLYIKISAFDKSYASDAVYRSYILKHLVADRCVRVEKRAGICALGA